MVKEVLAQPILTTGEYVERAERTLADYLGVAALPVCDELHRRNAHVAARARHRARR